MLARSPPLMLPLRGQALARVQARAGARSGGRSRARVRVACRAGGARWRGALVAPTRSPRALGTDLGAFTMAKLPHQNSDFGSNAQSALLIADDVAGGSLAGSIQHRWLEYVARMCRKCVQHACASSACTKCTSACSECAPSACAECVPTLRRVRGRRVWAPSVRLGGPRDSVRLWPQFGGRQAFCNQPWD